MTKGIEKAVQAFRFGQLQDAVTLYRTLQEAGHTMEDLAEWTEAEKDRRLREHDRARRERRVMARLAPRCPDCRGEMVLRPAGPDPDDGSHWTCTTCRRGIYDPRPAEEIMAEIRRRAKEELP